MAQGGQDPALGHEHVRFDDGLVPRPARPGGHAGGAVVLGELVDMFYATYSRVCGGRTYSNLGNLLRRLVLPVAIQSWSLTSLILYPT
jgi:hypothetical protein